MLTTAVLVCLHVPSTVAVSTLFVQTGLSCLALEQRAAALLLGVSGWALCTGFAINQLGELTFEGPDLARLGAYSALAQVCRRLGATQ